MPPILKNVNSKNLALVLSGGGARGAYEAGVLHYIRCCLPEALRQRPFDIVTGASVGAMNAAFVASTAHELEHQGERIYTLWSELKPENVYRRDNKALFRFIRKSSFDLIVRLMLGLKRGWPEPHFQGLFDTTPLLPYLHRAIHWENIGQNVKSGRIKALALIATNLFTGCPEIFLNRHRSVRYSGAYRIHSEMINATHTMASASIPIIFPSTIIRGVAYTDGSLRLNTPISPAIQLGADKVFVVSLHHHSVQRNQKAPYCDYVGLPPSVGQILGRVMNSLFLDHIEYDIEQLERINRIIEWSEQRYGKNYLAEINTMLIDRHIRGDIAERGLKKIEVFRIEPSVDLGELFIESLNSDRNYKFSSFEKMLIRALDIESSSGADFISYIIFNPTYLNALLDLGFKDAQNRHEEIVDFFENS